MDRSDTDSESYSYTSEGSVDGGYPSEPIKDEGFCYMCAKPVGEGEDCQCKCCQRCYLKSCSGCLVKVGYPFWFDRLSNSVKCPKHQQLLIINESATIDNEYCGYCVLEGGFYINRTTDAVFMGISDRELGIQFEYPKDEFSSNTPFRDSYQRGFDRIPRYFSAR